MISVIIPAFNAEKVLSQALDSLLDQTHLEILLIDDGSTDRTRSIAENHSARPIYFHQMNRGVAEARNSGIRQARGRYIAFLDADDSYLPGKLSSQSQFLDQNPQIDIVLCPIQLADQTLQPVGSPFICMSFGAALIRRDVFEKVGLCDPDFVQNEDTDWFLRARDFGIRIAYQKETGMLYRRHSENMTLDAQIGSDYFHRALYQSIRRRKHAY